MLNLKYYKYSKYELLLLLIHNVHQNAKINFKPTKRYPAVNHHDSGLSSFHGGNTLINYLN